MAGGVAKAHGRNVVDEYFGTSLGGLPGIGAAAGAVHAGIAHTQGGPAVNEDVRRTADSRAGDRVRAAVLAVAVGGAEGFVAYAAGWGHRHLTVLGYPAHQTSGKSGAGIFSWLGRAYICLAPDPRCPFHPNIRKKASRLGCQSLLAETRFTSWPSFSVIRYSEQRAIFCIQ